MKVIIIGGGAAGFFAAISLAEANKNAQVTIIEKTSKFLTKVKVSGGGRCNVTNNCFNPVILSGNYPRGNKELKNIFKQFSAEDTVKWFASRNVALKAENDGRIFPATDDSQTIIDCFFEYAHKLGIILKPSQAVESIRKEHGRFVITTAGDIYQADKVLIATGGNAHLHTYSWISELGHKIEPPIPSLFTFNDAAKGFIALAGISVPDAEIKIASTKLKQTGPLLITHWGLSGPAVIKLSAWAAQYLNAQNYSFTVLVSWIGARTEEELSTYLNYFKETNKLKKLYSHPLFELPQRLWEKLCEMAEIESSKIWAELPNRNLNKLLENLLRCQFKISGKTTFKEEFVTCGGVDLDEINLETMESKIIPGLYFAGEVLNIDGITGGFNFQAAWSTGWIAAKSIAAT